MILSSCKLALAINAAKYKQEMIKLNEKGSGPKKENDKMKEA